VLLLVSFYILILFVSSKPQAFEKLKKGIEENNFNYLKLYFAYRYGRPKIVQDVNLTTEQPLFDLS